MFRWLVLIFTLMFLAIPAHANGAMALVYGTFPWNIWLLYVVLMVLFEAVVLGRWAKIAFSSALSISVKANALTGVLGAVFSGVFGYMVYGIGGKSFVEPNPLGHAVFCLVVGGILSALIESNFWTKAAGRSATKASLIVHLIGVPLALMILLIPTRPYDGLEGQAAFRRNYVKKAIGKAMSESIRSEESGLYYSPGNWDELIKQIQPALSEQNRTYSNEVLQIAKFQPHFGRFDTGEAQREPCEFNRALIGKDLRKLEKTDWIVRWNYGSGSGITIEPPGSIFYVDSRLNEWLEKRRR